MSGKGPTLRELLADNPAAAKMIEEAFALGRALATPAAPVRTAAEERAPATCPVCGHCRVCGGRHCAGSDGEPPCFVARQERLLDDAAIATVRNAAILRAEGATEERAAIVAFIRAWADHYPPHVFLPPESGAHAATPDGCAAHALRGMLPVIANWIERGDHWPPAEDAGAGEEKKP